MLSFLDIIKIDIDSLNNISETLIVSLFVIDIKDVKTLFLSRLAQ